MASKKKILIVDDDAAVSFLLQTMAEIQGYAVQTVANGLEALPLLQHDTPDLIIADLMMPVMDGRTFLSEVRRRSETRHVPMLVLSSVPGLAANVADLSVDGCMAKPFGHDELVAQLDRLLAGAVHAKAS